MNPLVTAAKEPVTAANELVGARPPNMFVFQAASTGLASHCPGSLGS